MGWNYESALISNQKANDVPSFTSVLGGSLGGSGLGLLTKLADQRRDLLPVHALRRGETVLGNVPRLDVVFVETTTPGPVGSPRVPVEIGALGPGGGSHLGGRGRGWDNGLDAGGSGSGRDDLGAGRGGGGRLDGAGGRNSSLGGDSGRGSCWLDWSGCGGWGGTAPSDTKEAKGSLVESLGGLDIDGGSGSVAGQAKVGNDGD
jgi:hypothetical protein